MFGSGRRRGNTSCLPCVDVVDHHAPGARPRRGAQDLGGEQAPVRSSFQMIVLHVERALGPRRAVDAPVGEGHRVCSTSRTPLTSGEPPRSPSTAGVEPAVAAGGQA